MPCALPERLAIRVNTPRPATGRSIPLASGTSYFSHTVNSRPGGPGAGAGLARPVSPAVQAMSLGRLGRCSGMELTEHMRPLRAPRSMGP